MKKILGIAILASVFMITSCQNEGSEGASSTPIDSTNLNGTAPAEYNANDPENMNSPVYQGAGDTGIRSNNGTAADSNTGRMR